MQGAIQPLGLLALDVLLNDIMSRRLFTPVPDGDSGAPHDLPRVALRIELAEASPLPQFVVVVHFDEGNAVLLTQGLDELLVSCLVAVFCQHAEMSLAFVQSLQRDISTHEFSI